MNNNRSRVLSIECVTAGSTPSPIEVSSQEQGRNLKCMPFVAWEIQCRCSRVWCLQRCLHGKEPIRHKYNFPLFQVYKVCACVSCQGIRTEFHCIFVFSKLHESPFFFLFILCLVAFLSFTPYEFLAFKI